MIIKLILIFFMIALNVVAVLASGDSHQEDIRDLASMNIDSFIISESDKEVIYWIRLANTGEIVLRNITLIDIPPKGLRFKDSKYKLSGDRIPTEESFSMLVRGPEDFWIDNITWNLGNLQTSQEKIITLVLEKNASYGNNIQQNIAQVKYEGLNVAMENRTDKSAWSKHFETIEPYGLKLCDPESKINGNCVPQSPRIQVDGLLNVPKGLNGANYIVDVKNVGFVPLNDVILEVSLNGNGINFGKSIPSSLDLPQIASNKILKYWNIGSLSPGETSRVLVAVYTNGQPIMDELNKTTFLGYSWKGDDLITSGMKNPK
jgi:uncharacterized repeat protein (TIGR01451 family)